jgi:hypothetical protein
MANALTGSVAADGQTPITGNLQMSNNKITSLGTPTSAYDATTKYYVDGAITAATGSLGTMSSQNANNVAITGGTITGLSSALPVASGGTGVTISTGSGANVLGTSPTITSPTISGAIVSSMASSVITSGTPVSTTSGTSIDFTSIPSWVKRITVVFQTLGTSGGSIPIIQLGTSGGMTTTGYLGAATFLTSSVGTANFTTGFGIGDNSGSAHRRNGLMTIVNISGNTWAQSCVMGLSDTIETGISGGSIALSGSLTTVRLTTVNGTDTFTAGSINILYE